MFLMKFVFNNISYFVNVERSQQYLAKRIVQQKEFIFMLDHHDKTETVFVFRAIPNEQTQSILQAQKIPEQYAEMIDMIFKDINQSE